MCADAFWRIAKAGTEKAVEVRNIGKASLQCDVANTDIAQVRCGKEHERMFQPQLSDVCRERCPRCLEQPLQIAWRDAQALRHFDEAEFWIGEVRSHVIERVATMALALLSPMGQRVVAASTARST